MDTEKIRLQNKVAELEEELRASLNARASTEAWAKRAEAERDEMRDALREFLLAENESDTVWYHKSYAAAWTRASKAAGLVMRDNNLVPEEDDGHG